MARGRRIEIADEPRDLIPPSYEWVEYASKIMNTQSYNSIHKYYKIGTRYVYSAEGWGGGAGDTFYTFGHIFVGIFSVINIGNIGKHFLFFFITFRNNSPIM